MTTGYRSPVGWLWWWRTAWALALCGVLLLAAACGDDGAEAASDTTTSTTASESDPADDEARLDEVVEALYAEHLAVCEALGPPAPDANHPDVRATSTGPVRDRLEELAEEFREEGLAYRCPDDSRVEFRVLAFEFGEFEGSDAAWLDLCLIDDSERVVVETGEVVGGGLTAAHLSDALLQVDGKWKLAERRVNDQWEGEGECDLD